MTKDRPTIRSTYDDRPASVPLMGASIGTAFLAIAAVVIFIGGLSIWWLYVRTNTAAEIRQDGFNFQQGQVDAVIGYNSDLAGIDAQLADPATTDEQAAALTAQREAIRTNLCSHAARINNPKPTIHNIIIEENC